MGNEDWEDYSANGGAGDDGAEGEGAVREEVGWDTCYRCLNLSAFVPFTLLLHISLVTSTRKYGAKEKGDDVPGKNKKLHPIALTML